MAYNQLAVGNVEDEQFILGFRILINVLVN